MVEEILYDDLCFDCQQSTEKALKALLIFNDITFPKTHSVARLLELLESGGISIPEEVTEAVTLTDYAVTTRYPGVYDDVQESEYQESLVLAEQVFTWVKEQIEEPLYGTVDPHADEKPEEESN